MATAISVQQLAVSFRTRQGSVAALQPLDLELGAGRIVGILGPNGSGKTTLLRVLAGLQTPTSGRVQLLDRQANDPALRRLVAFQPDGPLPLGVLSAPEFLAYVGAQLGLPNAVSDARAQAWLERLELQHAGRRWVRTFSSGMQKRLALAAALLGEPSILLLDEPTSGLDPIGSGVVMQILRERAAAGMTILMASHHLLEVEEICDEVLVLQGGVLRARGTLAELLGTDADSLVVRGLDHDQLQQLAQAATALGGEVLRTERQRDHLFALFRRLANEPVRGQPK
ncbi:MAG: ABC transporter ATP-binding protein [Planctomycetes bacterium]|jgi:ABC-2 type transport system ATP-binding protein|nr:ABC transporter ATP-binding protein [Planctomycetota bacterium]